MKKYNTYIKLLICFLIAAVTNAQVAIVESFEGNTIPSGWDSTGFSVDETNPCDNSSVRAFFDAEGTKQLRTPEATSTGETIEMSFDYKIINGPNTVQASNIGTLELQYSTDNGTTWTSPMPMSDFVIDENNGYMANTACQNISRTFSDIPAGTVMFRFLYTWDNADGANPQYHLYIDNVQIIEQVDCVQPINLNADNITYDSFDLSWEEIDGSSEWEIYYGPAGSAPSDDNVETVTSETIPPNTSLTITDLSEGETYDVYIRSICGEGTESAWSNPISVQTKAFGSVCGTPINVMTLPYTQNNIDMAIYANNYTGSPGESCGTEGDYLNGYDIVFHYVPTQDDLIEINLSNLSIPHTGIFIYSSCADIGTNCLAGEINATNTDYGIEDFFVSAEEDYYIMVSTLQVQNFSFDIEIKGFDCDTFNAPNGETNQEFVAGQTLSDLYVTTTIEEASIKWYDDNPVPGPANIISDPSSEALVDGETYYVTQILGDCESAALEVTVTEFDCDNLSITNYEGNDVLCEEGTVNLSAEAATDNIYWYPSETSENVLAIGQNYTTPTLSETTSYWVSEAFIKEGITEGTGKSGPSVVETQWPNDIHLTGLDFEIYNTITLKSVEVYAVYEGTMDISIVSKTTAEIITEITVELPPASPDNPVPVTIEINEELQPGEYVISRGGGPPTVYDHFQNNNLNFPYPIGDSGKITTGFFFNIQGGTITTTPTYFFFYNWIIVEDQIVCESEREEIEVLVYEEVPIEVEASADVICIGDSVTLTATSTYENYEYTWSPGTMLMGDSITVMPTANTTYTLTAVDTLTGCETTETIDITVKGLPDTFTINPEVPTVCTGEVLRLTAGNLVYSFEGNSNWTTQDNSTPTDPGAEWQLVSSGFEIENNVISSKDNSQFYLSDARLNGPNDSVLESYLVSPSFNLGGTTGAFLRFDHYYKNHPTTSAKVEISVNEGEWQSIAVYEQSIAQPNNFATANIDLSAYAGFGNVKVRFSNTGLWGYWWAIDNVEIRRIYDEGTITWSINENLYVNANTTLPYNGENIATVYFKSAEAAAITLNANISIDDCFQATATTTVNVNSSNPPLITDSEYYFEEGETIQDMANEVTGDNLVWYVLDENEEYVAIGNPENTPLIHEETYYVSQTLMDCESELVELTAFFNCPAPRGLQVEQLTNTSAILTWEEHTEAELEKIEDFYLTVIQVGNQEIVFEEFIYWNGDNSILVTDLMQNTEYLFIVKSICDEDKGIESDPITSDNFTTLYLDSPLFNNLSYYPNPTKHQITIENAFPIEKIEVFSLTGKRIIVHKEPSNKVTMNLGALSGGTYLAKIYAGGTMKIIKIVKQ